MSSKYFTVRGKDYDEVRRKIFREYGDRARILNYRDVPVGGILGLFTKDQVECTGYLLKEPLPQGARQVPEDDQQSKKEILNLVGKNETLTTILADIKDIKEQIVAPRENLPHESLQKIEEILQNNDFSLSYIREITDKLKREFPLDDLNDFSLVQQSVAEWIYQALPLYDAQPPGSPEVLVLVGPTGVGKTTTIAKLAALKGIANAQGLSRKVCIITIDTYRIGARAQIEIYGEIMGIPVYQAGNYEELRKYITLHKDNDLILVDTIGKSPKDFKNLGEMRETLEACGSSAHFHLAMSSTTKTGDIREIIRQFDFFNYGSVVLTKLDETNHVGNLISILTEKKIPVSYLTNGQSVPSDIVDRDIKKTLMNKLQNLEFRFEKIERKLASSRQKRWN